MRAPLAIDLCSGLGGWAEGLEAEGWDVIRVDIADMFLETGTPKPPISARKNDHIGGGSWFAIGAPGQISVNGNPDGRKVPGFRFDGSGRSFQTASVAEHVKGSEGYERSHPNALGWKIPATSSKSPARKAASAKIAKIPFALSTHIARTFRPSESERTAA